VVVVVVDVLDPDVVHRKGGITLAKCSLASSAVISAFLFVDVEAVLDKLADAHFAVLFSGALEAVFV